MGHNSLRCCHGYDTSAGCLLAIINNHGVATAEYMNGDISTADSHNSLRPKQNRRHFADDVFKCNFLNENVWIPMKISLKFVPKVQINNIPALVQILAWRRSGDKPLSEPMMVSLPSLGLNELTRLQFQASHHIERTKYPFICQIWIKC